MGKTGNLEVKMLRSGRMEAQRPRAGRMEAQRRRAGKQAGGQTERQTGGGGGGFTCVDTGFQTRTRQQCDQELEKQCTVVQVRAQTKV